MPRLENMETVLAQPAVPQLPGRATACLIAQTLLYSFLAGWCLGVLPFPASGWMDAQTLPLAFTVVAVLGAAFFAPFMVSDDTGTNASRRIGLSIFSAAWQGLLLFFFLQLAARLSPLAANGSLLAGLWMFQIALLFQSVAKVAPRFYPALAFLWIAALPVFAYFLVELVLVGSGNVGWKDLKGASTESAALTVRVLLQGTPLSAVLGALTGNLLDGSPALFAWPMVALSAINGILGWRIASRPT